MNENANIVEEKVEEPETEAIETVNETEQADDLIEMYEDDTEDSEESDGFSTGAKLVLGLGGIAAAGLGFAGWKALKKRKNPQTPPADTTTENLGPAPIPDTIPNAKAVRGRKLTLRERMTGRLYIAPEEVTMMQELQELHEEEEKKEP